MMLNEVRSAALCRKSKVLSGLLLWVILGLLNSQGAEAATVSLSWNANPESNISAYLVSYGFSSQSYTNTVNNGTNTSFSLASLSPGQTVYFIVKAQNSEGLLSGSTEELAFQVGSGNGTPTPTPTPSPSPSPTPSATPTPAPFDPDTDGDGIKNSEDPDDDNDGLTDTEEAILGTDSLVVDTDGDGRNDAQEAKIDRSNALDPGHHKTVLSNRDCGDWNTMLTNRASKKIQHNIAEIRNISTSISQNVGIGIYNASGASIKQTSVFLSPLQEFDYTLDGQVPDNQIGSFCVSHTAPVDGSMVVYFEDLSSRAKKRYQFGFAMPFDDGELVDQAVTFNTYQASLLSTQQTFNVANWLTIRNASSKAGAGVVLVYNMVGQLLTSFPVSLSAGQRLDYDLHRFGKNIVGTAIFKPAQIDVRFVMRNIRYMYDNARWNSSFLTAFPVAARVGSGELQALPVNSLGGKTSIVEVSNVLPVASNVVLRVFGASGNLLLTQFLTLNAFESRHLLMNDTLGANAVGQVLLQSTARGGAIANALEYGYDRSGGLILMYGSPAASAFGKVLSTNYNSFLSHKNLAIFQNVTASAQTFVLKVVNYAGVARVAGSSITVPPNGTSTIDLSALVVGNEYGTVNIEAQNPDALLGIVERSRTSEYAMPLPIRDVTG